MALSDGDVRTVAAIAVVSSAPAVWWLGSGNAGVAAEADPDYLWQPLRMSTAVQSAIGIASIVLVLSALVVMAARMRAAELDRRWWGVVLPWVALSAYVGLTYRVATTPVIGANIGAGLMILGAIPLGCAALVLCTHFARATRPIRDTERRPSG